MKKQLLISLIFLAARVISFAGDAAAFVDLGLSQDGKTYVFAEYGRTDKTFQGYAEIYTVDIAKNDFIKDGVFIVPPSVSTASKSGKIVFDELYAKAEWYLKQFSLKPAAPENLLFADTCNNSEFEKEIVFKDYESSTSEQSLFYHIKLIKNVTGSGVSCQSSFFIDLEKQDENGKVITRNVVGSPAIKRKGVFDYKVNRVFSDKSGRNIVFVIEKLVEDSTGISVRYMVETVSL